MRERRNKTLKMKVLLAEDDQDIAKVLGIGLRNERMQVEHAATGFAAINMAISNSYDVILLDMMLPDKDGDEVCRILRNAKVKSSIIALTCVDDIQSKIKMFNIGVDDYITKPFDFDELFARIRASMRKYNIAAENILTYGDLTLDLTRHEAVRANKIIPLRDKELKILEYFMRHQGQVLTREMILNYVWGGHIERFTNVVDVHVHNLRDKIDTQADNKLIKTVNSVGYKFGK